jgi:3-oxoacyl-[acyl-carrier-protein] synthase II
MRKDRRIVISGLGVVSPNGIGKTAFWDALAAGKSGVDWITSFDTSKYPCRVAAEVRDFEPGDFMNVRRSQSWGRFSKLAVAAAKLALEDSKLDLMRVPSDRVMVCIGNAMNGSGDVYDVARVGFDKTGIEGIPRESGIEFSAHAPVTHVATELGIRGQGMTVSSACATGLDVVQWGMAQIQSGQADVVFAGGTEAPVSEFCFATLCAIPGAISTFDDPPLRASRPFDRRRNGLVLGEGAGVYVLEDIDHALDRGAPIYAEVLGFGGTNESDVAGHRSHKARSLALALSTALSRAGLTPNDIDYVNVHGNAMVEYDLIDTRAFRLVFGDAVNNIPFSSIKSMIGHAMGAAASLQVVATCMTLERGLIPPTINYEVPDPACDLDFVPNRARISRVRTALINSHAVGGGYSALVLKALAG